MSREGTHPKCPACNGGMVDIGDGCFAICSVCHGSGELPAVPSGFTRTPAPAMQVEGWEYPATEGMTFRDAQTATVIADLTEERDRWRAIALAAKPVLEQNPSAMASPSGVTAREVLAMFPKRGSDER